MQLAEMADDGFGPKLQRRRAAGVKPRRPAWNDLQAARRDAKRLQQGHGVGFDVEGAGDMRGRRPVASGGGKAAPHARGGEALACLAGVEKNLADFEQRLIAQAARGVAIGRGDKARQQARPHVGKIAGDRIGERQFRRAAAKSLRLLFRNEGPCHRFDEALAGERAPRVAGALLHQGQHGRGDAIRSRQRRRGHIVDADHAHDFFDDVGLALDVGAPARRGDMRDLGAGAFHAEAEALENHRRFFARNVETREAPRFAPGKIDRARESRKRAGERELRRRAAAHVEDELRRKLDPREREVGIDAAFETIARVGDDAELAAGMGDILRVPQRRLDQHVGRRFVAARRLAAHDAGKRFDARSRRR